MRTIFIVLIAGIVCSLARAQIVSQSWIAEPWPATPMWISKFELQIRKLWLADQLDEAQLDQICRSLAVSLRGGPKDKQAAVVKTAIVSAYFTHRMTKHKVDYVSVMRETLIPRCYETARACYIVFQREQAIMPNWQLVERFLKVWPQDPLIKMLAISKYGEAAAEFISLAKLGRFVKDLEKDYPQKDEVLLYYYIWYSVGLYDLKKDRQSLKKGLAYGEKYLTHPQVPPDQKRAMRTFLDSYRKKL